MKLNNWSFTRNKSMKLYGKSLSPTRKTWNCTNYAWKPIEE
jgi:hypothetical protein